MKINKTKTNEILGSMPRIQLETLAMELAERLIETEELSQLDNGTFIWPGSGDPLANMSMPEEEI